MESALPLANISNTWVWNCRPFHQLTVLELQAIHHIRQTVFVVEQNCAFLDADDVDGASHHLTAHGAESQLICAYARLVPPGIKHAEASIGRVLTHPSLRGQGLGNHLMQTAVHECLKLFPAAGLRISAQTHLERFYANWGFVRSGAPYLEDGISHIEMLRMVGNSVDN